MSFPKSVEILGSAFAVTVAPLDSTQAGFSSACDRVLRINSELPAETQVETFYHEVVHMWLELAGFNHLVGDGVDEALAQHLGYCLSLFVSTNPALPALTGENP